MERTRRSAEWKFDNEKAVDGWKVGEVEMTGGSQGAEEKNWFGARLMFAILVEGEDSDDACESIVVLRAEDHQAAFQRALEVGKGLERSYVNVEGGRVRWAFSQVVQVHFVGSEILDGEEVIFRLLDGPPLGIDSQFDPAAHEPNET